MSDPTKRMTVIDFVARTIEVPVGLTPWYSAAYYTPGQPGVFKVNGEAHDDTGMENNRYSYWNGHKFGPIHRTPKFAYSERFSPSAFTVTRFRGYTEEV